MIRVIIENLATIIISAILICLGVLAVIKIYKDKKKDDLYTLWREPQVIL